MSRRLRLLGVAGAVAFGCTSGPTAPSGASAACDPLSTSANAVLPIFGRPFDGAFPIGNFFDHDKPIDGDANGYVLTLCGARDTKQVDGHPDYDWRMPEGTPLFAVADAVVLTAGLSEGTVIGLSGSGEHGMLRGMSDARSTSRVSCGDDLVSIIEPSGGGACDHRAAGHRSPATRPGPATRRRGRLRGRQRQRPPRCG